VEDRFTGDKYVAKQMPLEEKDEKEKQLAQ